MSTGLELRSDAESQGAMIAEGRRRLSPGSLGQLLPEGREESLLWLLLVVSLGLRLFWIDHPENSLIFDERYYVNAARVIAGIPPGQNTYTDKLLGADPNIEHPPLAKIITAVTIRLYGDNAWGWRLPSVLFGVLCILLVFRIVRRLTDSPGAGLLAATLVAFDNLVFVHSRIFTLDISMLAFMLLGIDLYLGERRFLAGLAFAMATLCKLPGIFGLGVVGAYELLLLIRGTAPWWPELRQVVCRLVVTGAVCVVAFLGALWMIDRYWGSFATPFEHVGHILWYGQLLRRQAPSGVESLPWQWLWNEVQIPYLRVEQQVRVGTTLRENRAVIAFLGAMNPFVLGVWPLALPFAGYVWWRRRPGGHLGALAIAWFVMTLSPFVAASVLGQRISYLFYFLPTLPSVALAATVLLLHGGLPRVVLGTYLLAVLLGFYGYFPFKWVP